MNSQKLRHNPGSSTREVTVLRNLGLSEDEIRYLVRMKSKKDISSRWKS
jgi:hypothetical protein